MERKTREETSHGPSLEEQRRGVSGALSQWPLRLTAFSAGPSQTRDPQGVDHQGT